MTDAALVSVIPYPSQILQQKAILRKSRMVLEMGAEPVTISRTLPPSLALAALNTILSYRQCVTSPLLCKFSNLAFTAFYASQPLTPVVGILALSAPYILLYSLGTEGKSVG